MIALYILAYDGLVDYGAKAHYRVKHSKNEFANGKNHINGIKNFFSKRVRLISSKRSEAKHKTPYSFSSEVAFVYFKAKLLGGLGNLLIFFTLPSH